MRTKRGSCLFGAASAALALALAGCGSTPASSAGGSFAASSPSTSVSSASPSTSASGVMGATATAAPGAGAPSSSSSDSGAGSGGAGSGGAGYGGATLGGTEAAESGAFLPDRAVTPGATNSAVTQDDISSTICVSGWTTTVRPPSSFTSGLKLDQLRAGSAYNGDLNPSDYEEDHLIPLELGGAPSDVRNLWPEPSNAGVGSSGAKDQLENKLHGLVCSGQLALATAQQAIATDWWSAYETYVAQPAAQVPAPVAPAPVAPAPVAPAPAPAPVAPGGATAKCNDGSYSYSATHSGTCSHHGGVAIWYK